MARQDFRTLVNDHSAQVLNTAMRILGDTHVEPRSFLGRPNLIGQELSVNSEQEFNTWVRGAMAELSADRKAPVQVTYENVLRLAEQIRRQIK